MTSNLPTLLRNHLPLIDGGYGWLLQERGLEPGIPAEQWNLTNPAGIALLHEEYAAAGATILTTNTFGATAPRLAGYDLADQAEEIAERGATIAREVADRHGILVAGNIGPTGELLEPLGALSRDEAVEVFATQIRAMVRGGIDLVLIETMSDLEEASAAIEATRREAPGLPIVATMSFDTNLRTMMGVTPAAAVAALAAAGADAVGANCGRGPEDMIQIAASLVGARPEGLLLVAQSNAGLPQVSGDGFAYTVDAAGMAEHGVALREAGIDIVGACCGSSPDHIKAMANALR